MKQKYCSTSMILPRVYIHVYTYLHIYISIGPDSSSGKGSAWGEVGRGLESWQRHTNGIKMVLATPLLALALKD